MSTSTSFSVLSDGIDLWVEGELVVRFICPHCLKHLRRSYSLTLGRSGEIEPSPTETTCGHCGQKILLAVTEAFSVNCSVPFEKAKEG